MQAKKFSSIKLTHPDLAAEFDHEKKYPTVIEEVSFGSNRSIWWTCVHHGSWSQSPKARTRTGLKMACPSCRQFKILTPEYNFAIKYPDKAKQWDYEKNWPETPEGVLPNSDKIFFWKCPNNEHHGSFRQAAKTRAKGTRSGCRKCTSSVSSQEYRLFAELSYVLDGVSQQHSADKISIDIFLSSMNIAIEYDGYFWHKSKRQREKDKSKNEKLEKKGIKVLRLREAPLLKVSDYDVVILSSELCKNDIDSLIKNLLQHTQKGEYKKLKEYLSFPSFVNDGKYRELLLGNKPPHERSISVKTPELLKEFDFEANAPFTAEDFTFRSGKSVWWKCLKNSAHPIWQSSVANRRHRGCPACGGQSATEKYNLQSEFPAIAAEWDYSGNADLGGPSDHLPHSAKQVSWKCNIDPDHRWCQSIKRRTLRFTETGKAYCGFCSGKKVSLENSLKVLRPDLAYEWHPTKNGDQTPATVILGSAFSAVWLCKNGHEWEQRVCNRTRYSNSSGCKKCRSLSIKYPELVKEYDLNKNILDPLNISYGSGKKVWWRCLDCQHQWEMTVTSRTGNGSGCPKCKDRKKM